MSSGTLSSVQVLALSEEAHAVVVLSQRGIQELHSIDAANDFYHLPMQLLAQGFERLLKLTYALAKLKQEGQLPKSTDIRHKYGHNLSRLTDDLIALVEAEPDYIGRPAVKADIEFMRNDTDLRRILDLLSTFGAGSRYFRFDEFLDPASVNDDDDPDRAWEAMEGEIIRRDPAWLEKVKTGDRRAYREAAETIAGLLEQFGRAITRMWTLGAVHEEARAHLGVIKDFLFLRDHELGTQRL